MSEAGTTATEIHALLARLLVALDEAQYDARRGRTRPTMLQIIAAADRDEVAEAAQAALPGLVAAVAAAEAESGQTARTAAAAKALDSVTVTQLETLFRGLGAHVTLRPTATVIRFLEDTYVDEKKLREDAQRHIDGYVRLFARITGDRPLADYTRADILAWVGSLEKIKVTIGKSPTDRHKPISQIIAESRGKQTLNKTTIEKHIGHLKAFFLAAHTHNRWCARENVEDLFRGITLSAHVPPEQPRKSWTIVQLSELLASPIWSGTRSRREDVTKRHEPGPQIHRDAYYWLPVVALWTGARLEELAQLHHEDLMRDREGIPFLKIHNEGDRKVKTPHSLRNVPVHSFLQTIGFLDLFRSGARGRIWPELKKHGRPPSWGGLYSSHFTDYRKESSLYEPLRDFHSFRRTFVSALRDRLKVDALTVAAIVGHDDSDPEWRKVQQTNDYTDYSVRGLSEAIERLDYTAFGLDVSILTKTAAACGPRGSTRVDGFITATKEKDGLAPKLEHSADATEIVRPA